MALKIGEKILRALARKFGRAANREGINQDRAFLKAVTQEGSGTMTNDQKSEYLVSLHTYIAKQKRRQETGTALLPKKPKKKAVKKKTTTKKKATRKKTTTKKTTTKTRLARPKLTAIVAEATKGLSPHDKNIVRELMTKNDMKTLQKLLDKEPNKHRQKLIRAAMKDLPAYEQGLSNIFGSISDLFKYGN